MARYALIPSSASFATVGAASVQFAAVLAADDVWEFVSSTACFIAQGATPTASGAAGSVFVPPNTPVTIFAGNGATVAVIQQTAGGIATLTKLARL